MLTLEPPTKISRGDGTERNSESLAGSANSNDVFALGVAGKTVPRARNAARMDKNAIILSRNDFIYGY